MKTYPARFVGEFDEISYENYGSEIPNVGDVALISPRDEPHLFVRCACGSFNQLPIGNGPGWQFTSREPVHIEPSVRTHHYHKSGDSRMCHYFVHNGQLQMLDDTTAPLP